MKASGIAGRVSQFLSKDSDYAKREYGVTEAELKAFVKRADAELKRDCKAGRITGYTGDIRAAIRD